METSNKYEWIRRVDQIHIDLAYLLVDWNTLNSCCCFSRQNSLEWWFKIKQVVLLQLVNRRVNCSLPPSSLCVWKIRWTNESRWRWLTETSKEFNFVFIYPSVRQFLNVSSQNESENFIRNVLSRSLVPETCRGITDISKRCDKNNKEHIIVYN